MLYVRIYMEGKYWWFELVELGGRGFPREVTKVLYRRRSGSLQEAQESGEQARQHEIQKRRDIQTLIHETEKLL